MPVSGMAWASPPSACDASADEMIAHSVIVPSGLMPMSLANCMPEHRQGDAQDDRRGRRRSTPTIRHALRQPFAGLGRGWGPAHGRASRGTRSTGCPAALLRRRSPHPPRRLLLRAGLLRRHRLLWRRPSRAAAGRGARPSAAGGTACGAGRGAAWGGAPQVVGVARAGAAGAGGTGSGRGRPGVPPRARAGRGAPRAGHGVAGRLGLRRPAVPSVTLAAARDWAGPSPARHPCPASRWTFDRSPCGRGWLSALSGFAGRHSIPIRRRAVAPRHPAPRVRAAWVGRRPPTRDGIWSTIRARGWVAQRQSRRLITARSPVRILPPATTLDCPTPGPAPRRPCRRRGES